MKIVLDLKKIKLELERTSIYFGGHLLIVFLLQINHLFYSEHTLMTIFSLVFFALFYRNFLMVKKNLQYTYWSFFGFTVVYFLYYVFNPVTTIDTYFSILGLAFLSFEAYVLSSPIYYPKVSWWEYDFRYKDDLKIEIHFEDKIHRARLTDLRRNAGCVAIFNDLQMGDKFKLVYKGHIEEIELEAKVVSKRLYSLGRPLIYGVKFYLEDIPSRKNFRKLMRFWRSEKSFKRKLKTVDNKS